MTITIRSEVTGGTTTNGTNGQFTVTKPGTVNNGDVLVVIVGKQDDPLVAAPDASWASFGTGSTTGNDRFAGIFYKVITNAAGEPASYTFDSAGVSENVGWWAGALSGVATGTSIQDVAFTGAGFWATLSNDTSPAVPAVTTVTDGAMAFAVWVVNSSSGTMPGGDWANRAVNVGGGNVLFAASQTFASSGTSTGSPEITNLATTMESYVGTFVFRQATAPIFNDTLTLGRQQGVASSAQQDAQAPLTLGRLLAFTPTPTATLESALSLSRGEAFSTASELVSIYLVDDIILQWSSSPILEDSLSLGRTLTLALAETLTAEGALTLNRGESASLSAQADLQAALVLARAGQVNAVSQADLAESVSLSLQKSLTLSGGLDAFESISVGRRMGLSANSQADLGGLLTLSQRRGMIIVPGSTIIQIDHETGDFTQYTSVVNPGNLSVTGSAALQGTNYGLQSDILDTTPFYGEHHLTAPSVSGRVRWRFYLDPNTISMLVEDGFFFCTLYNSADQEIAFVMLYYSGGYFIRFVLGGDSGTTFSLPHAITDDSHCIELDLIRATSATSNNGSLQCWIDEVDTETLSGADNYDLFNNFDYVRFGAVSGVDTLTLGTFYLDEIVVNDSGVEIGRKIATYNLLISLGRAQSLQEDIQADFQASLVLPRQESVSASAQLDAQALLTLLSARALTVQSGLSLETALLLSRALTLSASSLISLEDSLALTLARQMQTASQADLAASLTLPRTLTLTASAVAELNASLTLQRFLAISAVGGGVWEATLTLPRQVALTTQELVTLENSLSLGRTLAVTFAPVSTLEAALTLTRQESLATTANAVYFTALTLARQMALTDSAGITFQAALSLLRQAALSLTSEVGTQTYNESLALARSLAVSTATLATLNVTTDLAQRLDLQTGATANLLASLSLGRSLSLSLTAGLLLTSLLTLSRSESLSDSASQVVEAAVGFTTALGLNQDPVADLAAQLSLGKTVALSATVTAVMETSTTLGRVLTLTVSGGLQYDETLALSLLQALTTASDLIAFLGSLPARLVIRDKTVWLMAGSDALSPLGGIIEEDDSGADLSIKDTTDV